MQITSGKIAGPQKIVVYGPEGIGKSTLLLHLNGILSHQTGELRICGLDVNAKNLGRVRAQMMGAAPICLMVRRTGTATRFKCMPISVPPISIPAAARTSSTRAGCSNACQQLVAQLPPAWGCGTAFTCS